MRRNASKEGTWTERRRTEGHREATEGSGRGKRQREAAEGSDRGKRARRDKEGRRDIGFATEGSDRGKRARRERGRERRRGEATRRRDGPWTERRRREASTERRRDGGNGIEEGQNDRGSRRGGLERRGGAARQEKGLLVRSQHGRVSFGNCLPMAQRLLRQLETIPQHLPRSRPCLPCA